MRWMLVFCLVAGCATGAEMRPRGKRNSLRIEQLEQRMAELEQKMQSQLDENRRLLQFLKERADAVLAPQPQPQP